MQRSTTNVGWHGTAGAERALQRVQLCVCRVHVMGEAGAGRAARPLLCTPVVHHVPTPPIVPPPINALALIGHNQRPLPQEFLPTH